MTEDTTIDPDSVFQVDTTDAKPLDPRDAKEHLEELFGLRGTITRLHRRMHELELRTEESLQDRRKQMLKVATTAVGIVDELRLLAADARRSLDEHGKTEDAEDGSDEKPASGWFGWGGRPEKKSAGSNSADSTISEEWLGVFERLASAAIRQLEECGIHHVPLLGKDLRDLQFESQPLRRWVSVKNQPDGEERIVDKEILGLWLTRVDKQLVPIQRGEVTVCGNGNV